MVKILDDDRLYIPVSELPDNLVAAITLDPFIKTHEIGRFGKCVNEAEYNAVLLENPDALEANGGHVELTRVDSLSTRLRDAQRLAPLKCMFLAGMGISDDEIDARIKKEYVEDADKAVLALRDTEGRMLGKYEKQTAFMQKSADAIQRNLNPLGLDVVLMTEIQAGHGAGLSCYVAGINVFHEIYLDVFEMDDWETFERTENGFRFMDHCEEGWQEITPHDWGRDFRKYGAMENLAWCLSNLDVKNEFSDELSYSGGGIYFTCNIALVARLFNHRAFSDRMFVNGFTEINEKVVTTHRKDIPDDVRDREEQK